MSMVIITDKKTTNEYGNYNWLQQMSMVIITDRKITNEYGN